MPAPLGVKPLSIAPPQFVTSPTYVDLLNETLGDTAAAFANIDSIITALQVESAAFEADVLTMDADIAAFEALMGLLDIGLPDQGSAPPIDPSLSYPMVDAYVTTQRDSFNALAGAFTDPGAVPLVLPNGGESVTLGLPPAQGGSPFAGDPPYTLQFFLSGVLAFATQLVVTAASGPNPPFTGTVQATTANGPAGANQNALNISVNPASVGSFTLTVTMTAVVVVGGAASHATITQPVVVNVVPQPPPPPIGPPPPVPLPTYVIPVTRAVAVSKGVVSVVVARQTLPDPPFQSFVITGFLQSRTLVQVNGNLTIDPNVASHGNYSGDCIVQVNYSDGTNTQIVLPFTVTV